MASRMRQKETEPCANCGDPAKFMIPRVPTIDNPEQMEDSWFCTQRCVKDYLSNFEVPDEEDEESGEYEEESE